jgi:hypothetical protein
LDGVNSPNRWISQALRRLAPGVVVTKSGRKEEGMVDALRPGKESLANVAPAPCELLATPPTFAPVCLGESVPKNCREQKEHRSVTEKCMDP